jgi:hypothetical protein
MSSLLQASGRMSRERGVEIFVYHVRANERYNNADGSPSMIGADPVETEEIPGCKYGPQPVLYRIWRKPCGMFGCWVLFRINGKECSLDHSVPTALLKLPRDAERLTTSEASEYWTR